MASEAFEHLKVRLAECRAAIDAVLPELAAARRAYATSRTDSDRGRLDLVQARAEDLMGDFRRLGNALADASGLPKEVLERLSEPEPSTEPDRRPREALTEDRIDSTGNMDAMLPEALESILARLPKGWLDREPAEGATLAGLVAPDAYLCLSRNLRQESEAPRLHRFRQTLLVARDRLARTPLFDHFAGAAVLAGVCSLGRGLQALDGLAHSGQRLERLWKRASAEVDSTVYELLVAAACAEFGREVEFIEESSAASPDLRCHDPFPLVIECKRQRGHLDFELKEMSVMRALFERLRAAARGIGLNGRFELRLTLPPAELGDPEAIVATLLRQRLAAHPERPLDYPWGSVAFRELPRRVRLPSVTRAYSPELLEHLFDYACDLPAWDGLCCSIAMNGEPILDTAVDPIALIWINTSDQAVQKRTRAPVNLAAKAFSQVPPGEFGLIYTAYVEGARAEIADARLDAFDIRFREFDHRGDIRVPISVLDRLYPRPLASGLPDMIESGVRYVSEACGDPGLFDHFPTVVYTRGAS